MIQNRDPITEWVNAIKTRLTTLAMIVIIMAFLCCLFAPLFGPIIKRIRRREFLMENNYEELVEKDMVKFYILLWSISITSWGILIWRLTING